MNIPDRDDYCFNDSCDEDKYNEDMERYSCYIDHKIDEIKEEKAELHLMNGNTEKILHDLNEELENEK
jgi:hypothetical protein